MNHKRTHDNGKEMWSTTYKLGLDNIVVASTPDIADLDNNGKPEVVFGDRKGRLFVLDGKTGSERARLQLPLGNMGENRAIFAVDYHKSANIIQKVRL